MAKRQQAKGAQSRREFIKGATAGLVATGIGPGVILESWGGENEVFHGMDARKLAAIDPADLEQVTFTSLSAYPCFEPNKSAQDSDRKKWAGVMSAVFPEGLDELKGMGWVEYDESLKNYVFVSDKPKLRLATAHLFAIPSIRRSASGGATGAPRQYSAFIANAPLEEEYQPGNPYGNSPYELFSAFFNSGGHLAFIKGGEKSLDAQARSWEKDNGIKLKGGTTLAGVSIILTPQPPELCCAENGGVKVSLIRREVMAADIAAHGKGFLDEAMMKDAALARFKAITGGKGAWRREFYGNLKADLKSDPRLSARMTALDGMADRKAVPEEAFLDVVSESLTAKAYPEDMKFINRVNYHSLFLDSPLLERPSDAQYPGYEKRPQTKVTAAVNAALAVKGTVVAKAIRDTDMEARCRQLSASFLKESELKPDLLSAVEDVFQGVFDAFGQRRAEFLEALKIRQDALETDEMAQRLKSISRIRESYLSNMAPWARQEFVDSAYGGLVKLKRALEEN
jgi:hypothetical protein